MPRKKVKEMTPLIARSILASYPEIPFTRQGQIALLDAMGYRNLSGRPIAQCPDNQVYRVAERVYWQAVRAKGGPGTETPILKVPDDELASLVMTAAQELLAEQPTIAEPIVTEAPPLDRARQHVLPLSARPPRAFIGGDQNPKEHYDSVYPCADSWEEYYRTGKANP